MSDETVVPVEDGSLEPSPMNPGGTHPAHAVEEDPEEHIGRRRKDPWVDDKQEDWPNNDAELDDSDEGDKS